MCDVIHSTYIKTIILYHHHHPKHCKLPIQEMEIICMIIIAVVASIMFIGLVMSAFRAAGVKSIVDPTDPTVDLS